MSALARVLLTSVRFLRSFSLAVPLLCFFTEAAYSASLLDRVVAIVNKEVITWSELYRTMEFEATNEMRSVGDAERKKIFKENEAVFLDSMIDRRLILQSARKLDITTGQDEVTEAVEGIKKKYSMSEDEFKESLKKEGFSLEEYKKRLGEQILLNKVVTQQVRSKIVISPQEINEYVAKNTDTEYSVRQILFRKPDKEPDREKVEAKAQEILRLLKQGESFVTLAQRYSEDPSARTGGDLGFIKRQLLSREFLEVLDQMAVGDVSKPFWTSRGLHIIKLEDKVDAQKPDEMREIAQKRLFEKRFNEEYRNWIRGLREKAYVEVRLEP